MPKISDISKWRTELLLAEGFRDSEFGEYRRDKRWKAGENIDYFEKGWGLGYIDNVETGDDSTATLNLFHALTKNVVPSLSFKNPTVSILPKRRADQDTAPLVANILNYYYKELEIDTENQKAVWDAYVLGKGYYKIGYATKFGVDIPDESTKKKKSKVDKALEAVGLKKPTEKEKVIKPDIDQKIIAERPYVQYISPFNILVDPRAASLDKALWWSHVVEKTVDSMKSNPKYKNTADLQGGEPEFPKSLHQRDQVSMSQLDEYKTVQLYEVHYRQPNGIYILVITKDAGQAGKFTEHYHDLSPYEMDEWQLDELDFGGHEHSYYKLSELSKLKPLQDRFTSTVDAILTQVDSFVPKIGVDETKLAGVQAKNTLLHGDIGAVVEFSGPPREAVTEISLTQFKADLKALNDEILNIATIQSGITKAQLTGVSKANTATEATIEQGGQTVRLSDMSQSVEKFYNRQARKLWQIIRQFVDLEELELITGESGINQETGLPVYDWLPEIDGPMSQKLAEGEYRFTINVGSTQKMDNAVVRKSIENLISILGRTDIIALMQQQGKKVDLAEILRRWLQTSPEIFVDVSKIIQNVSQQTPGLIPQDIVNSALGGGPGGVTAGSDTNQLRAQEGAPAPSQQQALSEASQI